MGNSSNKPDKPKVRMSTGARKSEERYDKMGTPEEKRERYYKVKVKATDPGARAGKAKSVKIKQISKERADKLKDREVRRDAENPGQLAQTIKKNTGTTDVQRYKATKISSGKSNLTVGGRVTKAFGGNPNQHQEKGTTGTHKFVAVKTPEPDKIKTIKPKSPVTPKQPDLPRMPVKVNEWKGEVEETPLNGGGTRQKKGISSKGNTVIKTVNKPTPKGTATKKQKYTINLGDGVKREVDKDDPRFKNYFKK